MIRLRQGCGGHVRAIRIVLWAAFAAAVIVAAVAIGSEPRRRPFSGPPHTGPVGPAEAGPSSELLAITSTGNLVRLDWIGTTDGVYRIERAAQIDGPWIEIGWTWAHSNEIHGIVLFTVYPATPAIGSTLAQAITQTDWGYTNDNPRWRAFGPKLPTNYPCAFTDTTLKSDDLNVFYRLRHQFEQLSSNDVLPAVQIVRRTGFQPVDFDSAANGQDARSTFVEARR